MHVLNTCTVLQQTFPDVLKASVPVPRWCKYLAVKGKEFPKALSFKLAPSIISALALTSERRT